MKFEGGRGSKKKSLFMSAFLTTLQTCKVKVHSERGTVLVNLFIANEPIWLIAHSVLESGWWTRKWYVNTGMQVKSNPEDAYETLDSSSSRSVLEHATEINRFLCKPYQFEHQNTRNSAYHLKVKFNMLDWTHLK